MINPYQKSVLMLALRAGEILLTSGSEIYRVEDTVARICKAFQIPFVEVFVIPTGIFLTLDAGQSDTLPYTVVKRIRGKGIDLEKISKVNAFSRQAVAGNMTVEEGQAILEEVEQTKKFKLPMQILGAGLISSFFTLMFGGSWNDFLCSLAIGAAGYGFALVLDRLNFNLYVRNFTACATVTLFSLFFVSIGIGTHLDPIIIGSLMIFLPGLALTNAVRDSLAGDMVAGSARGMEAGLIAISDAAGAALILSFWVFVGGIL